MENEDELMTGLFGAVVGFARENYPNEIDEAYEYFWEEEYPEDYLTGPALDVGFVNFEDWLVCDYRTKEGKGIIDLYMEANPGLGAKETASLGKMKDSVISLYEVKSTSPLALEDLLLGGSVTPEGRISGEGLSEGDIFGARFFKVGEQDVMSGSVYPFGKMKERALEHIDKQYNRYLKNDNSKGSMREFLKAYSDIFNVIWFSNLSGIR